MADEFTEKYVLWIRLLESSIEYKQNSTKNYIFNEFLEN